MKRRNVIVVVLVVSAMAVAVVAARRHWSTDGIAVTVVNRGPDMITDVEVQGLHHGYSLGQLALGESRSGRITTGSQSDIAVEFRDPKGVWHRVESGVTFKHNDLGKVTIEIERDTLAKVENQVKPGKE